MAISMLTALEIFTHPDDLRVEVPRRNLSGGYAIFVWRRGPVHNYKLLLSSKTFMATQEEAIEGILTILAAVCALGNNQFDIPDTSSNPQIESHEEILPVLTPQYINGIEKGLRDHGRVNTWELPPAPDTRLS